MPGGSLMSKPTWWKTFGSCATSAFFVFGHGAAAGVLRTNAMNKTPATKAKQLALLFDARQRAEGCFANMIQPFVSTDLT
jgi:hypothetical protein